MLCPICDADAGSARESCLRCGAPLGHPQATRQVLGVVDSTAARGPVRAELPLVLEAEGSEGMAAPPDALAGETRRRTSLVVMGPALPAVVWRQPAVRTLVQAGAGAVAMTLGMRLLRAWLARPRATRALASSALPVVAELLRQRDRPSLVPGERAEPGAEVVETVIFMRRVIRR
jgi:hypothetical protein